jgi:23S rRNA pseudouridine2457 synthase
VGLPTLRLLRVGIGPLRLDGLAAGEWRDLRPDEVQALHAMVSRPARKDFRPRR